MITTELFDPNEIENDLITATYRCENPFCATELENEYDENVIDVIKRREKRYFPPNPQFHIVGQQHCSICGNRMKLESISP